MTALEKLSEGMGKVGRIEAFLRQQKRLALDANDAQEVWTLAECIALIETLHREIKTDFAEARRELLRHRIEEHDVEIEALDNAA